MAKIEDKDGKTPLLEAVSAENLETVKLLIASGADLNTAGESMPKAIICETNGRIEDMDGKIPLQTAISVRNITIVELLLVNGANPNIAGEYSVRAT